MYRDDDKSDYYIWERNDGCTGCTRYKPKDWLTSTGPVSFKVLQVTNNWPDAQKFLQNRTANTAA